MVRKISDQGTVYHEPPYTEAEQMELYRCMNGVVAFTRPDPKGPKTEERPASEPAQQPQEEPSQGVPPREVDMLSLEHEHCRWPREDRSAPGGYVFCGAERSDVSAYCAEHNVIAYNPQPPRSS